MEQINRVEFEKPKIIQPNGKGPKIQIAKISKSGKTQKSSERATSKSITLENNYFNRQLTKF